MPATMPRQWVLQKSLCYGDIPFLKFELGTYVESQYLLPRWREKTSKKKDIETVFCPSSWHVVLWPSSLVADVNVGCSTDNDVIMTNVLCHATHVGHYDK